MDKIEKAIKNFEDFNNLKIKNYTSPNGNTEDALLIDYNIGSDVFPIKIQEWLEFFDEDDQGLFLDLLSRYRYYTERKIKRIIRDSMQKIIDDNGLSTFKDVIFVTYPSRNGVQSGGDFLRAYLGLEFLGELSKQQNTIAGGEELKSSYKNAKIIVFLDDIVGSGYTLYSNLSKFLSECHISNQQKIYTFCICSREKKIKKKMADLKKAYGNIEIIPIIYEEMDKALAIKYYDSESSRGRALERVKHYENLIYENMVDDTEKDCREGFKQGQFLVSFCYNTPNNTLSTFWLPSKISMPLFVRSSYKRPSIVDIRKQRKENADRAYQLSCKKG